MITESQQTAVSNLIETEEGQNKFIDALVPSLRRRGEVNIVELCQVWSPRLRPGQWKVLARVLYTAAKKAGIRIIDDLVRPDVPSAEWVEDWVTPRISST